MKKFLAAAVLAAMLATPAAAWDLNKVTEKTAEELAGWMHPETRHLAADVIEICAEEEVSAEFIAAVMRWERRPDLHNWFGWSENGLLEFENDRECLETVIPKIKANYLTPGGIYYEGATVSGVAIHYNNSAIWRETMLKEMERMG